jgi:hypothetical protein
MPKALWRDDKRRGKYHYMFEVEVVLSKNKEGVWKVQLV